MTDRKAVSHLCQNDGYRQKYFIILFLYCKDYTLKYSPVKYYNLIISFIRRRIFSFGVNQLRMDHL